MMMTERQQTVCAIALFVDGYCKDQIAVALGLDPEQAQQLIDAGADAQANGTMGHMARLHTANSRGDDE